MGCATIGPLEPEMDLPGDNPVAEPIPGQVEAAAEAINAAERPIFYVGGGCVSSPRVVAGSGGTSA